MSRTPLDGMRHGPCSSHNFSRIGMGALRASFEAMFKGITGKELKTVAFGTPARHLLVRHTSTLAVAEGYSRYQPTARYRVLRRRHARV